ncbi:hypothetical protein [Petroclostridium xylanilyticum]|uniref:hypothetical protein n=1 Tax=Petroclostridium xylanilyticum TaxID=1792311 RepID=UPI000B988B2C|nr:hypothetical protein [Petroclostridium xylanilyticum]
MEKSDPRETVRPSEANKKLPLKALRGRGEFGMGKAHFFNLNKYNKIIKLLSTFSVIYIN